ncbi:hypothetical protein FHETE_1384 [Fusarium heterosporum]|uniref:Uncharacterized protein n=1 Tax=Fusarium heterosporum TaxID=42747 RepID=A0A8H5WWE0_FUSHE|nr:hypothetical protein FHETE_1384 [Fusarium heterosporum]
MVLKTVISAVTLTAFVAAKPYSTPCASQGICIDAINDCGVQYGGCYDICSPELSPIPPPCTPYTPTPYPTITPITPDPTITLFLD